MIIVVNAAIHVIMGRADRKILEEIQATHTSRTVRLVGTIEEACDEIDGLRAVKSVLNTHFDSTGDTTYSDRQIRVLENLFERCAQNGTVHDIYGGRSDSTAIRQHDDVRKRITSKPELHRYLFKKIEDPHPWYNFILITYLDENREARDRAYFGWGGNFVSGVHYVFASEDAALVATFKEAHQALRLYHKMSEGLQKS